MAIVEASPRELPAPSCHLREHPGVTCYSARSTWLVECSTFCRTLVRGAMRENFTPAGPLTLLWQLRAHVGKCEAVEHCKSQESPSCVTCHLSPPCGQRVATAKPPSRESPSDAVSTTDLAIIMGIGSDGLGCGRLAFSSAGSHEIKKIL